MAIAQALPLEEKFLEESPSSALSAESDAISEAAVTPLVEEQTGTENKTTSLQGVYEEGPGDYLLDILAPLVPHMAIAGGVIVCLAMINGCKSCKWMRSQHE